MRERERERVVRTMVARAGPRPRPNAPPKKKKFPLGKKAPHPMIKDSNFYKIKYIYIYIYKGCAFFFITNDVNDTINFTISLQIVMLLITKK